MGAPVGHPGEGVTDNRRSNRSRLLILTGARSIHGGVEHIIDDLCRGLPDYGFDVRVGLGEGFCNDGNRYRSAYPHQTTVGIDGRWGTRQSRIEALIRVFKAQAPDIVLTARLADAYEAVRRLKRRGWDLRLVTTIQAFEPHYLWDARGYRSIMDHVVTSGELIRRALLDWGGFEAGRVTSIPGGVMPVPHPPERDYGRPVLRIGYVGRLDQVQKRIGDLPLIVDLLEGRGVPFTLTVAGTGPEQQKTDAALRRRLPKDRYRFLGWQSRQVLYSEVYPRLDVLLHLAAVEGVTIAPREAMAHGVVPVISDFPGLRTERHFRHGENALVFPVGDTAAAARRVEALHRDRSLLETLSNGARHSQRGIYSAEGALRAWAEVFRGVLARPARQGPVLARPDYGSGLLDRMGLPPWVAQRIRQLLGRHHRHRDGGSEWPTACLACPRSAAEALEVWRDRLEGQGETGRCPESVT